MVLDGAIDPALSTANLAAAEAASFEGQYRDFAAWCRRAGCPWNGPDPIRQFLDLVAAVRAHPAPAGGGLLGPGEVYLGALDRLYSPSGWDQLGRALYAARGGDGAPLRALSDDYLTRGSSNFNDANMAYNCVDHPTPRTIAGVARDARAAAVNAPIFGPFLAWGALSCAVWPARPTTRPRVVTAAGAPPILVVAALGDPATPYAWARSVASTLRRSALLTVRSTSHVVALSSPCTLAVVARYLLEGVTPPAGAQCS
jgi:hypothetical protein